MGLSNIIFLPLQFSNIQRSAWENRRDDRQGDHSFQLGSSFAFEAWKPTMKADNKFKKNIMLSWGKCIQDCHQNWQAMWRAITGMTNVLLFERQRVELKKIALTPAEHFSRSVKDYICWNAKERGLNSCKQCKKPHSTSLVQDVTGGKSMENGLGSIGVQSKSLYTFGLAQTLRIATRVSEGVFTHPYPSLVRPVWKGW